MFPVRTYAGTGYFPIFDILPYDCVPCHLAGSSIAEGRSREMYRCAERPQPKMKL